VNLQKLHFKRCARKRAFPAPREADEAAQCASIKTGERIISYQCGDCLKWHIGHAPTAPAYPLCEICQQPIAPSRLESGRRKQRRITTCSRRCERALAKRREPQPDVPNQPVTKSLEKQSS
jgi:hypothetical protein